MTRDGEVFALAFPPSEALASRCELIPVNPEVNDREKILLSPSSSLWNTARNVFRYIKLPFSAATIYLVRSSLSSDDFLTVLSKW